MHDLSRDVQGLGPPLREQDHRLRVRRLEEKRNRHQVVTTSAKRERARKAFQTARRNQGKYEHLMSVPVRAHRRSLPDDGSAKVVRVHRYRRAEPGRSSAPTRAIVDLNGGHGSPDWVVVKLNRKTGRATGILRDARKGDFGLAHRSVRELG